MLNLSSVMLNLTFSKLFNIFINEMNVLDHILSKVPLHNSNLIYLYLKITLKHVFIFHKVYITYDEVDININTVYFA